MRRLIFTIPVLALSAAASFAQAPAAKAAATPAAPTQRRRVVRFLPIALIGLVSLTVIALGWHNHLSFAGLLASRAAIDAMVAGHPIAALAAFTGIYAVAVALSLPGAVFLTICGGAVFGAVPTRAEEARFPGSVPYI